MTHVAALDRLSLRRLTFDDATRLLPYAATFSASVSIGLVGLKVWRTPHFAHVAVVSRWAIGVLVASIVLSVGLRRSLSLWRRWVTEEGVIAWLVSFGVSAALLVVPVLLLVKSVPEDDMTGWPLPLVNKRWFVALYGVAIATFFVFPAAVARLRSGAGMNDAFPAQALARSPSRRRWLWLAFGQVAIVVICWYLAGPPWHLDRYHRPIDFHEQLHFGPLQAISKGYLPFIGPAATPYGPGSQLLVYGLMKWLGAFDLVSFRTAWAIQQFVAVLLVGTAAYWWLGPIPAFAVIVLSFTYSPLAFFETAPDGTWAGVYGWSNGLRYVPPLIVVPSIAAAATRDESRAWIIWLLGIGWGVGAFLAQEGLTSTATATVLVLTLLWLTRTIPLNRAAWLLGHLLAGFFTVVVTVLLYYAAQGAAREFLRVYFVFARAIAVGYANAWWSESTRPDRWSYYFTVPFLIACALCALWRLPALRLVTPLDHARARFIAFIAVLLVCFQTALHRSDAAHLMNTMTALPFVLVLGFIDLPRWVAERPLGRWAVRAIFTAVVLMIYPTVRIAAESNRWTRPMARFETGSVPQPAATPDNRMAVTRLTPAFANDTVLVENALSAPELLDFATEVHDLIGQRRTYYLQIGWTAGGGLIAFMADLMPASHPIGGELLSMNDLIKTSVANHIRAHPNEYEAFIGPSLTDPEARAFLESHPGAAVLEKPLGKSIVYILLSRL